MQWPDGLVHHLARARGIPICHKPGFLIMYPEIQLSCYFDDNSEMLSLFLKENIVF